MMGKLAHQKPPNHITIYFLLKIVFSFFLLDSDMFWEVFWVYHFFVSSIFYQKNKNTLLENGTTCTKFSRLQLRSVFCRRTVAISPQTMSFCTRYFPDFDRIKPEIKPNYWVISNLGYKFCAVNFAGKMLKIRQNEANMCHMCLSRCAGCYGPRVTFVAHSVSVCLAVCNSGPMVGP